MSEYQTIQFEQAGRIARITLNRPDAANGIDHVLSGELARIAEYCADDPALKVVTLTGAGKFFSAGGDLKAMAGQGGSAGAYVKGLADDLHRAMSLFARMDALLIIGVNGVAAGAGFSLAISGDLVVASESAKFTMAYTRAGLSPDGGASYYLPRLVGLRRTQELMLTNRTLSAAEALDWGLVNRVVPAADVAATVTELAETFAAGPKVSNAHVKKLLLVTYNHRLEEQMATESGFIADCGDSPDGREGVAAFLGKRAPHFG
jgi:2-(1,2-epoxy-1,2-dihydrophenyl)acetyl-CoA isomerase